MNKAYSFDWSDVAFGSKKTVSGLKATFIAAPRELSAARFTQLVKELLPSGNIILGLTKEPFIHGFEGQPQFRSLQASAVQHVIDKVNASALPHKIYTLHYFQREAKYIFDKLQFRQVLLVNGSWKYSFHTQELYYVLASKRIDYKMVSPFASEQEARDYETKCWPEMLTALPTLTQNRSTHTEQQMLEVAADAAKLSYDYSFQTGVALGKQTGKGTDKYKLLGYSFNRVVPFQTYALHYGASRETHFSPPHDLNHYDTVHAEVEMLIKAQKEGIDLRDTTLFINLLPCPSCSRMFCETDIAEFVYSEDHSAGYAVALLEKAGKTVRRIVAPDVIRG